MSKFAGGPVGEELAAKFVRLGGVKWLRQAIAEAAEAPGDERPLRGVPPEERVVIATTIAPAKTVARTHRIPVHAVYRLRKELAPLSRMPNAPG